MSAFEIWNKLVTEGWKCLAQWQTDRQPETLHLEFKSAWLKDGDVAAENLGELAAGCSGFGNIDGGVMVFGAKTVRGPGKADVLDVLTGVKSLADYAERMRSRLLTPEAHQVEAATTLTQGAGNIRAPEGRSRKCSIVPQTSRRRSRVAEQIAHLTYGEP